MEKKSLRGDKLSLCYDLADTWFRFFARSNSKLYIIPYKFTPEGKLEIRSKRQLLVHYIVLSMLVMCIIHKLAVFCYGIFSAGSGIEDIRTFISIVPFIIYFVPLTVASAVLFRREEKVCILNTWNEVLASFQPGNRDDGGVFRNIQAVLLVVSMCEFCWVAGFGVSSLGFVFEALPVSYFTAADEGFSLLDTALMSKNMWKLVLWPLELATYMPPPLVGAWCGMVNMMVVIVMKSCLEELRYRKFPL